MSDKNPNQAAAMFWASVIARAWEDQDFKEQLLKDAGAALQEMGYDSFRQDSSDGQKFTIKVKEAPNFKCVDFDSSTNTMTINLPDSPNGFENLDFTGVFGPGWCC